MSEHIWVEGVLPSSVKATSKIRVSHRFNPDHAMILETSKLRDCNSSPPGPSTTMAGERFASLMAAADASQSEIDRKLARLKQVQQSEQARRQQADLLQKEHKKQEQWNQVLEKHEKQVIAANKPPPPPPKTAVPAKPKILQPQRSMTFKKLLKEASKVDASTFKVGPKVKVQPKIPEKAKSSTDKSAIKQGDSKSALVSQHPPSKSSSSQLHKSALERVFSSQSRSVSPHSSGSSPSVKKPSLGMAIHKPLKQTGTAKVGGSDGKDAKSRLKASFSANELIPLAQGPRRDLRTIEEIQNDLWRKKGKNYPSVTGKPKEPSRNLFQNSGSPAPTGGRRKSETGAVKRQAQEAPRKRPLEEEEESDVDSFVAHSDEEEIDEPEKFDYRAEIRALFKRPGQERTYDEDDSDMEATGFEVEREEARAARLARLEDEEEAKREEARIREKKKRKLEAEKRKS